MMHEARPPIVRMRSCGANALCVTLYIRAQEAILTGWAVYHIISKRDQNDRFQRCIVAGRRVPLYTAYDIQEQLGKRSASRRRVGTGTAPQRVQPSAQPQEGGKNRAGKIQRRRINAKKRWRCLYLCHPPLPELGGIVFKEGKERKVQPKFHPSSCFGQRFDGDVEEAERGQTLANFGMGCVSVTGYERILNDGGNLGIASYLLLY